MRVVHVVPNLRASSIPVEIAAAMDDLEGLTSRIVSEQPVPDEIADTVSEEQVLTSRCDIDDYNSLVGFLSNEFDLVQTQHVGPAAHAGYYARNRPIVHCNTQQGHSHYTLTEKIKNLPGIFFSDAIIYNSRSTADSYNLFESILKAKKIDHLVYNGVNLEKIEPYQAEIDEVRTLATAAHFIPRKNLEILVRILSLIDRLELVMIGDGPERETLEELARQLDVRSRIEFTGFISSRRAIYERLSQADVFALPSHGEGFCLAVAEAMGVGLPVVVSNISTFREVVGDGGVFVDRTSPKSVANAIRDLQGDPGQAEQLGKQNRRRIFDQFSLQKCVNGYRNVYEEVV